MVNWKPAFAFLALYLLTSVLYTTRNLLCAAQDIILSCSSSLITGSIPSWIPSNEVGASLEDPIQHLLRISSTHSSDGFSPTPPFLLPESLLLSKAFSQSLQPSKIYPYFYRATTNFEHEDITVTTLITRNRLTVFRELVLNYNGPISVTMHIDDDQQEIQETLQELHELQISTPRMSELVDVHVVLDSFDRQFNTWRNIARFFARTDYVMMLDVDFFICTDFRSAMRASAPVMKLLREGKSAFVIPAFEFLKVEDQSSPLSAFPRDKQSLVKAVDNERIGMFHASWEPGHNSTEYGRYYNASQGEVYKVTKYQACYEPYVVFKKTVPPWCDERFVGYGGNKASCLFEMYLSGISYYVLSDHFLIHQGHPYEEAARKSERKVNRKLYQEFRMETCLRYIKAYHASKLLYTPVGFNLQQECRKIGGLSKTMYQPKLDAFVTHSKPAPSPVASSQEVRDHGSIFSAHIYRATSAEQATSVVKHLKFVEHAQKPATHEMSAWRCMVLKHGKTGLSGDDDFELKQGSKDDGERWGGERILRVMQNLGVIDAVVVVSRWYGGIMLGPARFAHIETCTQEVCQSFIQKEQLEESLASLNSLDDILADLRRELAELTGSSKGSSQTSTKKVDYQAKEDFDLAKAKRLITARENSIKAVKVALAKKREDISQPSREGLQPAILKDVAPRDSESLVS